jgi:hypothetical protein
MYLMPKKIVPKPVAEFIEPEDVIEMEDDYECEPSPVQEDHKDDVLKKAREIANKNISADLKARISASRNAPPPIGVMDLNKRKNIKTLVDNDLPIKTSIDPLIENIEEFDPDDIIEIDEDTEDLVQYKRGDSQVVEAAPARKAGIPIAKIALVKRQMSTENKRPDNTIFVDKKAYGKLTVPDDVIVEEFSRKAPGFRAEKEAAFKKAGVPIARIGVKKRLMPRPKKEMLESSAVPEYEIEIEGLDSWNSVADRHVPPTVSTKEQKKEAAAVPAPISVRRQSSLRDHKEAVAAAALAAALGGAAIGSAVREARQERYQEKTQQQVVETTKRNNAPSAKVVDQAKPYEVKTANTKPTESIKKFLGVPDTKPGNIEAAKTGGEKQTLDLKEMVAVKKIELGKKTVNQAALELVGGYFQGKSVLPTNEQMTNMAANLRFFLEHDGELKVKGHTVFSGDGKYAEKIKLVKNRAGAKTIEYDESSLDEMMSILKARSEGLRITGDDGGTFTPRPMGGSSGLARAATAVKGFFNKLRGK